MSTTEATAVLDAPAAATGRDHRRKGAVVAGVFSVVILVLILYPILNMFVRTFVVDGALSLEPFGALFESRGIMTTAANTGVYTVGTVVLAVSGGAFLAWANERTDAHMGWVSGILPIVPLLFPLIGGALGYVFLFAGNSGLVNVLIRQVLGVEGGQGPVDIYNFGGLIIVTAIYLAPLSYLVISAAFKNVDPALDEASRVAGASPWRTLRKVTFPAVAPGLASAALLVAIFTMGTFSVPLVIGTSADIQVLSVYVYQAFASYPPRVEVGVALGVVLLVLVQLLVIVQSRIARSAKRSTLGGRGRTASVVRLGRWRPAVRAALIGYLVLGLVLPLVGLVAVSFQPYWGSQLSWSGWTTDNYTFVLGSAHTRQALINSLMLGAVGGVSVMLIATALTMIARGTRRSGRLIEGILMFPSTIPHIVLGIAFLVSFSRPPVNLYGTTMLVYLAYLVIFMPQAVTSAHSAVSQLSSELVEASRVSGASALRTARRVIFPQLLPGLAAGWVIVFVLMANEVTASSLLGGLNNPVVGQAIVELFLNGTVNQLAVLALMITVADVVIVLALTRLVRRAYNPARS